MPKKDCARFLTNVHPNSGDKMNKTLPQPQDTDAVSQVVDDTMRGLFGYQLKRTFNVIQDDLAKTLKPFGLRMLTYTALVLIVDNPGLRQSQLADAMDVERPNLVVLIDELERRDLIVRDRVPTDRRAHALRATRAGRLLRDQSVAAVTEHEARLLRGVEKENIASAMGVLKTIEATKHGSRS